jgi:CRP/FNR family transcriptional regulator, cyclic AMP receptor protein
MTLDSLLKDLFFVKDVSDEGVCELAAMLAVYRYPRGNILYYHGEPADSVFILLDGKVKVSLISEDGREVVLATILNGSIFGIIAALDGGAHIGNAMTTADSQVARISTDRLVGWMKRHPSSHGPVAEQLAHMLRAAYSKIGAQSLLPVRERLLGAIVQMARAEGTVGANGVVSFRRPTHKELAEIVGSSRVVVSRVLNEILTKNGIIATGRVIRLPLDRIESGMNGEFHA